MQKYVQNKKKSNLESKVFYLGIFLAVFFFRKYVIFEISILEFVKMQIFVKKSKYLKFGPKYICGLQL